MEDTRRQCYSTKTAAYVEGTNSVLKICKKTRKLYVCPKDDPDFVACLEMRGIPAGQIYCLIGKIEIEHNTYILYVTEASVIAKFFDKEKSLPIYRIDRVEALQLIDDEQFLIFSNDGQGAPAVKSGNFATQAANKFKLGQKAFFKYVTKKIPGTIPVLLDEVLRLFNDVPDFYFCTERDITHTTQRHFEGASMPDERFFWNRDILQDLGSSERELSHKREWLIPIMQGHVQAKELFVDDGDPSSSKPSLSMTLLSRRSVHRAGARFLRRGIDEQGYVANFVESELLLNIFGHHVSFVQIRGSIPLFWSQKGLHYRPPLSIDRNLEDSLPFFQKHMDFLAGDYGHPIIIVNLVNQSGRELKLATSFLEHVVAQNADNVEYFSFDFHHHCRGLNFDKIVDLINALEPSLKDLGFCWIDKLGEIVRKQTGIVRTNCVDCLDRTNVVQGAISQFVCFGQARRLGLFGPLNDPPDSLIAALQLLWADNGDSISTQYAGTAALKGDMTRYGERKITGIMKDGYNSASRYYLSHMRDANRQRAMNALLGIEEEALQPSEEDSDSEEDANVGRLVAETVHFLLPENEVLVGGWALVDARNRTQQCDSVVLLTRSLYLACYDEDAEKLLEVKIIPLEEISMVEIGPTNYSSCIHIRFADANGSWVFHAGKTRLFNNVAIRIKSDEEGDEYVQSILEQLKVTLEMTFNKELVVGYPQRIATNQDTTKKRFTRMSAMFGKMRTSKPEILKATNGQPKTDSTEKINSDLTKQESNLLDQRPAQDKMKTSESDSHLAGLVARIKGFRGTGSEATPQLSPFSYLKPKIDVCKSKIVLL